MSLSLGSKSAVAQPVSTCEVKMIGGSGGEIDLGAYSKEEDRYSFAQTRGNGVQEFDYTCKRACSSLGYEYSYVGQDLTLGYEGTPKIVNQILNVSKSTAAKPYYDLVNDPRAFPTLVGHGWFFRSFPWVNPREKGYPYVFENSTKHKYLGLSLADYSSALASDCFCMNYSGCLPSCNVYDTTPIVFDAATVGSIATEKTTKFSPFSQKVPFCPNAPLAFATWKQFQNGSICSADIITSSVDTLINKDGPSPVTIAMTSKEGVVKTEVPLQSLVLENGRIHLEKFIPASELSATISSNPSCSISVGDSSGRPSAKTALYCGCPTGFMNWLKGYRSSSAFSYLKSPNEVTLVADEFNIPIFESRFTPKELEFEYVQKKPDGFASISDCLANYKEVISLNGETGANAATLTVKVFNNQSEIKVGMIEYYLVKDQITQTQKNYTERISQNDATRDIFNKNNLIPSISVNEITWKKSVNTYTETLERGFEMWKSNNVMNVIFPHEQAYHQWMLTGPNFSVLQPNNTPWIVKAADAYVKNKPIPAGGNLSKEFFNEVCDGFPCARWQDVVQAVIDAREWHSAAYERNANYFPWLQEGGRRDKWFSKGPIVSSPTPPTEATLLAFLAPKVIKVLEDENKMLKARLDELDKVKSYMLCPTSVNNLSEGALEKVLSYLEPAEDTTSLAEISAKNIPQKNKKMQIEIARLRFQSQQRRDVKVLNLRSDQLIGETALSAVLPGAIGKAAFLALARSRVIWMATRGFLDKVVVGLREAFGIKRVLRGVTLAKETLARIRDLEFTGKMVKGLGGLSKGGAEIANVVFGIGDAVAVGNGMSRYIALRQGVCDPLINPEASGDAANDMGPYLQCIDDAIKSVSDGYYTALATSGAVIVAAKQGLLFTRETTKLIESAGLSGGVLYNGGYGSTTPGTFESILTAMRKGTVPLPPGGLKWQLHKERVVMPHLLEAELNGANIGEVDNLKLFEDSLSAHGWSKVRVEGQVRYHERDGVTLSIHVGEVKDFEYADFWGYSEPGIVVRAPNSTLSYQPGNRIHINLVHYTRYCSTPKEFLDMTLGTIGHEEIHALMHRIPEVGRRHFKGYNPATRTFSFNSYTNPEPATRVLGELIAQAYNTNKRDLHQFAMRAVMKDIADVYRYTLREVGTGGYTKEIYVMQEAMLRKALLGQGPAASLPIYASWHEQKNPIARYIDYSKSQQILVSKGFSNNREKLEEEVTANIIGFIQEDIDSLVNFQSKYVGDNAILGALLGVVPAEGVLIR